jgi:alkaline phosphatase
LLETVGTLRALVEQLFVALDYPGITLVMIFVAPEMTMPLTGFFVSEGVFAFVPALLAATLGAMLGQLAIYALARRLGEMRLRGAIRRYGRWVLFYEEDLDRGLELFSRYDDWALVVGRFLPTVRSLVTLPAGLQKMSLRRFTILTLIGTGLWNAILAGFGVLLGRHWQLMVDVLSVYGTVVGIALIVLIVVLFAPRIRRVVALLR